MAYIDLNQPPVQEPQLTQAPTNYGGVLGGFGSRLQGLLQSEGWARMLEGAANSDNTWQGLAQAGAGYVRGNRAQMQQEQLDAEQQQRRAALNNWLRQRSGLSPQDQQLMQANPEIGGQYAAEVLKPQQYEPPKAPQVQDFYDEKTGQPYKAQWDPQSQSWNRIGGMKATTNGMTITTNPDGTTTVSYGGTPAKMTEDQSKSVGLLTRATSAAQILDSNEAALTGKVDSALGSLPGVGNMLVSKDYQVAQQAGREFLAAVLRKDSGAAVTQGEMDTYGRMYLPQPGDAPEVLAQKKQSRAVALEGIRRGLGTAQSLVPEANQPPPGAAPAQNDPLGIR